MKKNLTCVLLSSLIFSGVFAVFAEDGKKTELCDNILNLSEDKFSDCSFLALAFRTKYVERWGILINFEKESLNDHLLDTSRIVHILVLIKNKKYGGNLNAERAAILAMYHDLAEIATDDMPTPVKYSQKEMKEIYDKIEDQVIEELILKLPAELRNDFYSILKRQNNEKELWQIVKYADVISAFLKSFREKSLGNKDFDNAYNQIKKRLLKIEAPEVKYFIKTFLPAFGIEISEFIT